jgi:hypothetical protein
MLARVAPVLFVLLLGVVTPPGTMFRVSCVAVPRSCLAAAIRHVADGRNGHPRNGSGRGPLPFASEDVPASLLNHPYWDMDDFGSPYENMPWWLGAAEEGESPLNLRNVFADDAELLEAEQLKK